MFRDLYADDTVLIAEQQAIIKHYFKFCLYCDTWKMKVNVDKTKIVVFSKGCL